MQPPEHNTINDFEPDHFFASFFRTAMAVFLYPMPFFEGMKRDGGFRNPLIFLACCVIIHALLAGLFHKNPSLIAHNLALGIVTPFLTAGALFFFITSVFKVSGTYEAAFRVNAYSAVAAMLSWIPVVGLLFQFYSLYLIVVGLSCVFSIKTSRAVLAIVLTLCVYLMASAAIAHITGGKWPQPMH